MSAVSERAAEIDALIVSLSADEAKSLAGRLAAQVGYDLPATISRLEEERTLLLGAVDDTSTALCGTPPRSIVDTAWAVGKLAKIMRAALAERERAELAEAAMREAIDLLLERKHGNSARSAAHNARVALQFALTGTVTAPPQGSQGEPVACVSPDQLAAHRERMNLRPVAAYLLKDAEQGSWGFIHNGRQARLLAHYVDGPASPPSAAEEA